MGENEMKPEAGLPERVRLNEGLGGAARLCDPALRTCNGASLLVLQLLQSVKDVCRDAVHAFRAATALGSDVCTERLILRGELLNDGPGLHCINEKFAMNFQDSSQTIAYRFLTETLMKLEGDVVRQIEECRVDGRFSLLLSAC